MKEEHFKFASEKKQRKIVANNVHHANFGGESFLGPSTLSSAGVSGPSLAMPRQPSWFSEKFNRSWPLFRKVPRINRTSQKPPTHQSKWESWNPITPRPFLLHTLSAPGPDRSTSHPISAPPSSKFPTRFASEIFVSASLEFSDGS